MSVFLDAYGFKKVQSEREVSNRIPFSSSNLQEPSTFSEAIRISHRAKLYGVNRKGPRIFAGNSFQKPVTGNLLVLSYALNMIKCVSEEALSGRITVFSSF